MKEIDIKQVKDECIKWIRNWFEINGKGCNAVLGLSGGKDSTIVAKLCVEAIGKDRVIGVAMPDTLQGLNEADKIAEYLGIKFIYAPIDRITNEYKNVFTGTEASTQTLQNIPPRVRMTMLYAIAQTYNGRVIGTTNLDERLTGYFTKYGDGLACDIEPIELLTVREVIKIGELLGLPKKWLYKVPSADLPHTKTDEEELGFSYSDFDDYIRNDNNVQKETVDKIENRIKKYLFKLKPIAHYVPYFDDENKR